MAARVGSQPGQRQTVMTSATWPADMQRFAQAYLRREAHHEAHIGGAGSALNARARSSANAADSADVIADSADESMRKFPPPRGIFVT